jgi:hypothetical protein
VTKDLESIDVVAVEMRDSPDAVRPDVKDPGLEVAWLRRHAVIVGATASRARVDFVTNQRRYFVTNQRR